jgi:DNA-binding LytR/AlgR family response regulator
MLSVMVVDDEPLARRKLASLLAQIPWAVQVGEAKDGGSALDAIARLKPDVVLLDVQMPELSGIELVSRLQAMSFVPVVIFATAHDHYALTAFELEAIDYLQKPFDERRLTKALERARRAVDNRTASAALGRASALFASDPALPLARILVRSGTAIVPLTLGEIERFEAQDDYVMVHLQGRHHLVSLRLADLEARLPNPPFLRVHRSHVVNFDLVERITPLESGRLEAQMASGALVPISKARAQIIRHLAH